MSMAKRRSEAELGFTLIELMTVVAIVGVIAAVAYPAYLKSLRKSDRSDAETTLAGLAQTLERCYTQNFTYTNCTNVTPTPSPATTARSFYTLAATATTNTYTLTANAIGNQVNDTGCTAMSLDNTGAKSPVSCWQN